MKLGQLNIRHLLKNLKINKQACKITYNPIWDQLIYEHCAKVFRNSFLKRKN